MVHFFVLCVGLVLSLITSCFQEANATVFASQAIQKPIVVQKVKKLIVIDPGHGGADIGAKVQSVEEKMLALKVALLVKRSLCDKGYCVVLTRTCDMLVPLNKRSAIANTTRSALFISIHFNACKGENVKGIEVYYYGKGAKWRQNASQKLAQAVLNSLISATNAPSRGVKKGNFYVIRNVCMPAILIEGGFLTNRQECNRLQDKIYIRKMAYSISEAIDTYFCSTYLN